METKDYIEIICKNCKNYSKCNNGSIIVKNDSIFNSFDFHMKTIYCENYINNYKHKNSFYYKGKRFEY